MHPEAENGRRMYFHVAEIKGFRGDELSSVINPEIQEFAVL